MGEGVGWARAGEGVARARTWARPAEGEDEGG